MHAILPPEGYTQAMDIWTIIGAAAKSGLVAGLIGGVVGGIIGGLRATKKRQQTPDDPPA
jgi:hypothetical protein